jgi:predicted O-methyltransferase YrrM
VIEPASHVVAHPELWSCYDDQTAEDEVVNLIVALVGAIKPHTVVEVGTYLGYTSAAIGQIVRGYGHLHAFEADPSLAQQASERCQHLPVTIINSVDTDFDPAPISPVDFLFVDGALDNRGSSLAHWRPALAPGALIAVHDSLKYPEVTAAVDGFGALQRLDVVTPRGLTLMRNVS